MFRRSYARPSAARVSTLYPRARVAAKRSYKRPVFTRKRVVYRRAKVYRRRVGRPVRRRYVRRGAVRLRGRGDYQVHVPRLRGKGDYFGDVGSSLGRAAGSAVGGVVGDIGKLFGVGDYTPKPLRVKKNSLAHAGMLTGNKVPQMASYGRLNAFAHREYLADVVSSDEKGSFSILKLAINPGLDATFPWLSTIAENYEEYKIHGMVFEYRSSYSDAVVGDSSSGTLGTIIMATQYNVSKADFASKMEMENHEFSTSGKVSETFLHPIECNMSENPLKVLFTRHSGPPIPGVTEDPKFMDLANFFIATKGVQTTDDTLGELWVSYHVECLKPRMKIPSQNSELLWTAGQWAFGAGATMVDYFGGGDSGDILWHPQSTLTPPHCVAVAATMPQLIFAPTEEKGPSLPSGNYLFCSFIQGGAVAYEAGTPTEFPGLPGMTATGVGGYAELLLFGQADNKYSLVYTPVLAGQDMAGVTVLLQMIAFTIDSDALDSLVYEPGTSTTCQLPGFDADGGDGNCFLLNLSPEWQNVYGSALHAKLFNAVNHIGHPMAKMFNQKTKTFPFLETHWADPVSASVPLSTGSIGLISGYQQSHRKPVPRRLPRPGFAGLQAIPKSTAGALARAPTVKLNDKGEWIMVPTPEEKKEEKKA